MLMNVQGQRETPRTPIYDSLTYFFETGSLTNFELICPLVTLSDPLISTCHSAGVIDTCMTVCLALKDHNTEIKAYVFVLVHSCLWSHLSDPSYMYI